MNILAAKLNKIKAKKIKSTTAFTIAEVLITLAIIGIIATLTIPNILKKYNDRIIVTKVKKAHNMLQYAWQMAEQQNGDYIEFLKEKEQEGKSGYDATLEYLSDNLKIIKDCGTTAGNCRPEYWNGCQNNNEKFPDAFRNQADRCVILEGGMLFCLNSEHKPTSRCDRNYQECALMHIDINGKKGPNTYSIDDFWWEYSKEKKFQPVVDWWSDTPHEDIGCDNSAYGTCRARLNAVRWILLKDNVDYLHKHVSW